MDAESLTVERLLKSVDLKAIGNHVALAVAEFISQPEVLDVLVEFFAGQKKAARTKRRPRKKAGTVSPACAEEGCDKPAIAKGLCSRHYQRMR